MRTIVQVSPASNLVGVSRHVLSLSRLLTKNGIPVAVLCPTWGWLAREATKLGITTITYGPPGGPLSALRASSVIRGFISEQRTGPVVHAHGRYATLVSRLALVGTGGIKFSVAIHQLRDSRTPDRRVLVQRVFEFVASNADALWFVSHAVAESYPYLERHQWRRVIPNWLDDDHQTSTAHASRAQGGLLEDPQLILGIGRLHPVKGWDRLLHTLHALDRSGLDFRCKILGEGPERSALEQLRTVLGLDGSVSIPGEDADLRSHYEKASCVAIPSRSESFGLVALEAFGAGVPVVASNVPGLREVCEGAAVLVDFADPERSAKAIHEVASDPDLRARLIERGRIRVERYRPDEKFEAKVVRYFEELSLEHHHGGER